MVRNDQKLNEIRLSRVQSRAGRCKIDEGVGAGGRRRDGGWGWGWGEAPCGLGLGLGLVLGLGLGLIFLVHLELGFWLGPSTHIDPNNHIFL